MAEEEVRDESVVDGDEEADTVPPVTPGEDDADEDTDEEDSEDSDEA